MFFCHKKWPVYLLAAILIIAQFAIIVCLVVHMARLEKSYAETRDSLSMRLNQIYSQVFLMNTRMNQILEKK